MRRSGVRSSSSPPESRPCVDLPTSGRRTTLRQHDPRDCVEAREEAAARQSLRSRSGSVATGWRRARGVRVRPRGCSSNRNAFLPIVHRSGSRGIRVSRSGSCWSRARSPTPGIAAAQVLSWRLHQFSRARQRLSGRFRRNSSITCSRPSGKQGIAIGGSSGQTLQRLARTPSAPTRRPRRLVTAWQRVPRPLTSIEYAAKVQHAGQCGPSLRLEKHVADVLPQLRTDGAYDQGNPPNEALSGDSCRNPYRTVHHRVRIAMNHSVLPDRLSTDRLQVCQPPAGFD